MPVKQENPKAYVIRVNVGGNQLQDYVGNPWSADREYSSGRWGCLDTPTTDTQSTGDQIGGTEIPEILKSMRVGEKLRYRFDVPNGKYKVTLLFAEIYWTTADAEHQEVLVQGKKVLTDFNIFDDVGHDTAFEKNVEVVVADRRLDIECRGMSLPMHSGARISGIEIKGEQPLRQPQSKPDAGKGPYNVVLISLDTVRRDYLHAYGHRKKLSPAIDKIAQTGAMFDDCVVNCGWTLPQHMTLVTGTYPIRHGMVFLEKNKRLSNRIKTLAEIFRDQGYMTFGFGNQNGYGGGWEYGFERGMRYYNTIFPFNNMMEPAADFVSQAVNSAKDAPFFLYLHTNDTHEPFEASEPFGSMWGNEYINKYEGEISYVDHYLGKIFDTIKDAGVLNKTLIVITSDHGSEFAEHGFFEKKLNFYEEISRIPLIMRLPGEIPSRSKVPGQCQTVDIAPTILDMCSIPIPDQMDGTSLLPRIKGKKKTGPATVFAHTLHETMFNYEHFSARTERYKFIRCAPFNKRPEKMKGVLGARFTRLLSTADVKNGYCRELYDLKNDPLEKKNIYSGAGKTASELESRLDRWISQCGYKPRKPGSGK